MSRKLFAALVAVLAILAVTIGAIAGVFDSDTDVSPVDPVVLTVPVDGPDPDTKPDDTITLGPQSQELLQDNLAKPAEATPEGELEAAPLGAGAGVPLRDAGPIVTQEGPLAAQELPGCRTRFVGNSSSRNGSVPGVIVWHQTVSRENGLSSQNALTAMAARASSGVSWHALVGRSRGLCTFTVPLNLKAWTQGNANPVAIGIEVEAVGDEGTYVTGAGKAKLIQITRFMGKRYAIPMQHGKVTFDSNCRPTVTRKGIVEHSELGRCGGGHSDVTLSGVPQVIAEAAGPVCGVACERRQRHIAAHRELRARHCAKADQTKSARCTVLHRRLRALHKVGVTF